MEISGKIIEVLNLQTGEGRNGTWKKQNFILETQEQYPKKVCIMVWGDKVDQFNLTVGAEVTVSINIESREYNGRWYTDIKAWKMTSGSGEQTSNSTASTSAPADIPPPPPEPQMAADDDLPF